MLAWRDTDLIGRDPDLAELRRHLGDGLRRDEAVLAPTHGSTQNGRDPAIRHGAAVVALRLCDVDVDQPNARHFLWRWAKDGARPDIAGALDMLGLEAETRGDLETAAKWYRLSLKESESEAEPEPGAVAAVRCRLGNVLLAQGDLDGAQRHLAAALDGHRTARSLTGQASSLAALCLVSLQRKDLYRACRHARDALGLVASGEVLAMSAILAVHLGLDEAAARLFGSTSGEGLRAGAQATHRHARHLARLRLGHKTFDEAYARGRMLTPAVAAELARQVATDRDESGLTRRELEVADLIAAGLTNRQIAQRLVLGVRTIDTHVARIRSKLDLPTREQVAVWAAFRSRA